MNYFSYGGTDCREFGLYITGQPYAVPQKNIEFITIPGRSGSLTISDGSFADVEISYYAYMRRPLAENTRKMKAWLLGNAGYQALKNTYDPNYFRYAIFAGPADFTQTLNRVGECTLNFICKPFLYSLGGQSPIALNKQGLIFNPEAFQSLPLLRIFGQGQCEIYINNSTLQIKDVNEWVEVDSEAKTISKALTPMANNAIGAYPVLQSGNNIIEWNENVSKIEIIPRWCTL